MSAPLHHATTPSTIVASVTITDTRYRAEEASDARGLYSRGGEKDVEQRNKQARGESTPGHRRTFREAASSAPSMETGDRHHCQHGADTRAQTGGSRVGTFCCCYTVLIRCFMQSWSSHDTGTIPIRRRPRPLRHARILPSEWHLALVYFVSRTNKHRHHIELPSVFRSMQGGSEVRAALSEPPNCVRGPEYAIFEAVLDHQTHKIKKALTWNHTAASLGS